jgi:outer membrane cobalamin receptor
MSSRIILLASAALFFTATSAKAQQQPAPAPPDEEYEGEGETIVVTCQRPRGSVIGDIPPENVLDSRDVRATGATSIAELLEALSPQLGSARGRGGERPILLLNGQRISGFRELRDVPTEAIERVEILPEEVALKYGYRADQRVMNIVLRERFRSTAARAGVGVPTEGGNVSGETDLTRLLIGSGGRTTLNIHVEGDTMLTEAERDIEVAGDGPDAGEARSLVGSSRQMRHRDRQLHTPRQCRRHLERRAPAPGRAFAERP